MKGTIRRRQNKDGSVSFVCQVKAGRDPATGRERVLTGTANSERAAHKLVHDLVTKAASDEVVAADVTLNQAIDRWLELSGPSEASTRVTYAGYISKHIRQDIGLVKLGKLRAQDLDRWYTRLRGKGLAPASIRKCPRHSVRRAHPGEEVGLGGRERGAAGVTAARPETCCAHARSRPGASDARGHRGV